MRLRKFFTLLLVFALTAGCFNVPVNAIGEPSGKVIDLQSLERICLDMSSVKQWETSSSPRALGTLDTTVSANSIVLSQERLYLDATETVTINCSYNPASASVDFGLVNSDNVFYHVNVTNGSVNQTIRITQRGYYTVAIRNNSSYAISVVGYVNY